MSAIPAEGLVELARSAREDSLRQVFETVATAMRTIAGFGTVVVNRYRRAWNDYEVVLVHGDDDVNETLRGTTLPAESLEQLMACEVPVLPGVYFLRAESAGWLALETYFTPDIPPSEDPERWQAEDGLLVLLTDAAGQPLGLLSMDEPADGLRPRPDTLSVVRAIALHAEQAIESAQHNERAAESERLSAQLLAVSPVLSGCSTGRQLFETVCDTIVGHMGFERVAVYAHARGDQLERYLTRGWDSSERPAERLPASGLAPLLDPLSERAGCWLIDAATLFGSRPAGERSARNGRGPHGWNEHALLVPAFDGPTGLRWLLAVEDPVDHALPTEQRRRALRQLMNHAAAAWQLIDHRMYLNHLAEHDPLTGLRNRRGLDALLGVHQEAALLVCDLDHFKRINDRYGHAVGDRVLERFGQLLREVARSTDIPIRLGGEEFCIVLPQTDEAGAMDAAERLRRETSGRMSDIVAESVTVSIGVAATSDGLLDARGLLAAADRGLYAAKAAGRNRTRRGSTRMD